jgi:hypothetical protein
MDVIIIYGQILGESIEEYLNTWSIGISVWLV